MGKSPGNAESGTGWDQAALKSPATRFQIDPRAIVAPTRAMQAYQVKLGSLEKELPFDGLFETQYYERAVKAGS